MDSNKRLIKWFNDAEDEDWTSEPFVRHKDDTIDDDWGLEKQSHCFLFRGVVTQVLERNEILLDDNSLIKYDVGISS